MYSLNYVDVINFSSEYLLYMKRSNAKVWTKPIATEPANNQAIYNLVRETLNTCQDILATIAELRDAAMDGESTAVSSEELEDA